MERADARRAHRSGRRVRARRLDGGRPRQRALPPGRAPERRRAVPALVARPTSPTPRTTPRCSKRCARSRELDDVAWLTEASSPASSSGSSTMPTVEASSRPVPTPSSSSSGLKDVFDDATPSASSARGERSVAARGPDRRNPVRGVRRRSVAGCSRMHGASHPNGRASPRCDRALRDQPRRDRDHRRAGRRADPRACGARWLPGCCPPSVTLTGSPNDPSPLLAGAKCGVAFRPPTSASTTRANSR